jgi:rRNA maturation RNase YbeY
MTVRLTGRRGLPQLDRARLRRRAAGILRALGLPEAELSVQLIGDAEMAELNGRYRRRRGPTDVLSFSLVEGHFAERRGALLGDVVVSLETAARQAGRGRRTLEDEVLRLLVHGVLHLIGHDHVRAREARAMRAEERRVMRARRAQVRELRA